MLPLTIAQRHVAPPSPPCTVLPPPPETDRATLGSARITSRRALASLRRSDSAAAATRPGLASGRARRGVLLDLASTTGSWPAAMRASAPREARSPITLRLTTGIGN